jgi:hypothetical protein
MSPLHPDAPHRTAAQKAPRLVVELLADFFADLSERIRIAEYRLGVDDFDIHRKILGATGLADSRSFAARGLGLRSRCIHGGRYRTRLVKTAEQKFKLPGIELLALAHRERPHAGGCSAHV